MKIGIDASRYKSEQATGVEWYSWHIINALLKELKGSEDKVTLYSRNSIDRNDVKVKVLEAKRLWTLRALSKEMDKNPPDLLFVPSHTLPLKLPKRSVIMIHDVAFKYLRKSYSFSQYQYLNWSTKYAVKHATKILVPSMATKEDLVNLFNCPVRKIEVIYHGFSAPNSEANNDFDLEIFKYFDIDEKSKYLLFIGRLETKKNLSNLVLAFSKFLKGNPGFKLVLAGKRGVGFNKFLKTVVKEGLEKDVIMPGYITEEEKAALFRNCQGFVFPSLYEGFGLPILEAFSYKKPILCSNCSSLPEVAGEAAIYCDPYDVDSIKKGLEVLAKNDEYIEDLVKKGSERLKEFSWEKAAKETLKVLHG